MQRKERYIWLGTGALAITIFALVAFSPTAVAQSNASDSEEYLKTFRDVFRFIEENFVEEVDPKTLYEGALKGMFDTLDDPYSYYLDVDGMESLTDITTGNFVFNVTKAYMVEKGEITHPVRGASLIGRGAEILERVDMVASDLDYGYGTCGKDGQLVPVCVGQPSLRISGMTVGGTQV